jgi:aminoglycoside 3-N-acetyltransferase
MPSANHVPSTKVTTETEKDSWRTRVSAQAYFALRELLSQSRRDSLKRTVAAGRQRLKRVYILVNGKFTAKELVQELSSKIGDNFEILMVHSSFDGLLPMYQGTPQELVSELLNLCGSNRTLAMPAFVLGGRLYDKRKYFGSHPFDCRRTPSEMGLLTEVFRRTPDTLRSLHPTHSVCAHGPLARTLTETHHLCETRVGLGTPFDLMTQRRTAIVGLGVKYFRCLTQTHTPEDILGEAFPVPFQRDTFPVLLVDGQGRKKPYSLTIPRTSYRMDNTVLRSLLPKDALKEWTYRGTSLFATEAAIVTQTLVESARRGVTLYKAREKAHA